MNGLLLQPGRNEEGLRAPGSHRVTGWSSYLFFKSSGFLCESLTEQHPFTGLPHMIRPRLFVQAHRGISPVDSWIQPSHSAGHDFEGITELTMAIQCLG